MQGDETYKYKPLSYFNNFDQIKFSLHFPIYITEKVIGRIGGKHRGLIELWIWSVNRGHMQFTRQCILDNYGWTGLNP
jgi:hypothetical protein